MSTLLSFLFSFCQNSITPSESLLITGRVKKDINMDIASLDTFKKTVLENVSITNSKGEVKEKINALEGISLNELFEKVAFDAAGHKDLNRYYLVFTATDNFKLVLSWNEIFHSEKCNDYYLVTKTDGKKLGQLDKRIMIMEISDPLFGHERIEGLKQIKVAEAN